ncbi:glycosyltransferase family 2 protein [Paenibacillus albidus]|uniref:glycosyltransferase family 2 protein n=1 Tax=Paenibacillus albidus TaxID=2041023 RepID=UPI001BE9E3C4|nr:glycosyltransferase family 2 protein [Paenibacillus albidus]MBT2289847.1 glycosyltransferase family 2 protein [Paenibacillus albidus]
MKKEPAVTVLMPVYNGEKYLAEAIESILNQTFADFEFLIINDASKDRTVEIIESYKDERIRLVHNEQNLRLIATLNKGIGLARGTYLARMDADDISVPQRLERQVAFLDANPGIAVCGCWADMIGENAGHIWKFPMTHEEIKARLLFENCISHPGVTVRRSILEDPALRYDPQYTHVEDWEFWSHISMEHKLHNLQEILLHYRLNDNSVSRLYEDEQSFNNRKVFIPYLKRLGIEPAEAEIDTHRRFNFEPWPFTPDRAFIESCHTWLMKLQAANRAQGIYAEPAFTNQLAQKWYLVCSRSRNLGWWVWTQFWKSPLINNRRLSIKQRTKFILKSAAGKN